MKNERTIIRRDGGLERPDDQCVRSGRRRGDSWRNEGDPELMHAGEDVGLGDEERREVDLPVTLYYTIIAGLWNQ